MERETNSEEMMTLDEHAQILERMAELWNGPELDALQAGARVLRSQEALFDELTTALARAFDAEAALAALRSHEGRAGQPSPQSDILAWLNVEQRKPERWTYGNRGIYRFGLVGPELMRIRHALGSMSGEWQCRFVADDKRCCQLPIGHDGEHQFVALTALRGHVFASSDAEVKRLTQGLRQVNADLEDYERRYYLTLDRAEQAEADLAALRSQPDVTQALDDFHVAWSPDIGSFSPKECKARLDTLITAARSQPEGQITVGKWWIGQAGNCNVVAFDGDNIIGIANIPSGVDAERVVTAHNATVNTE